jgi:hypothetical protein
MSKIQYYREVLCARRPKSDGFEDTSSFPEDDLDEELLEEEEEVEEEVDFENSSFGSGREEIWTDYAEDLDYDQ